MAQTMSMSSGQYEAKTAVIDGATYHYNEVNYYWERFDFYKAIGASFSECKQGAKHDTDEKFGRTH